MPAPPRSENDGAERLRLEKSFAVSPWLFDAEIDYPESTNCSLLVLNKDNGVWSHLHGMMQPPNKLSFLPGQQHSREGVQAP